MKIAPIALLASAMSSSVAASGIAGALPFLGLQHSSSNDEHDEHDFGDDPCFPEWGLVGGCVITSGRPDALKCMVECDEGAHDPNTCAGGCGMVDDCRANCLGDDTCKDEIYKAMQCYACDCTQSGEATTLPGPVDAFASSSADADLCVDETSAVGDCFSGGGVDPIIAEHCFWGCGEDIMEASPPTSCDSYCADVVDVCYAKCDAGGICKDEVYPYVNCHLANSQEPEICNCAAPANRFKLDVAGVTKKNLRA